jgi:hypothetical protein
VFKLKQVGRVLIITLASSYQIDRTEFTVYKKYAGGVIVKDSNNTKMSCDDMLTIISRARKDKKVIRVICNKEIYNLIEKQAITDEI